MLLRNFLLLMNGRKSARGCLCVEEHAGKGDIRVHLKNSLRLHHGGFPFFRYILVRSCNAGAALRGSAPSITPARELSSLDLPFLLRTMRPYQLVRAPREHCAFLCALRRSEGRRDSVPLHPLPGN